MATVPVEPTSSNDASTVAPVDRWARIDDWCERFGDSVNPILVKETRQALKSRQFVVTFSLLLTAALGWTVVGSLMAMPQIYTSPSAPEMLIGYYFVLAIPMLLIVPLAAYRSLEAEIDDGTLELLSITTLSPWQIVLGKLASAALQMVLYFVALLPCVAYAYTLRGVDLPTTFLMVAILVFAAMFLTIVALFFAPLSRGRTSRITNLLVVIMILLISEYLLGVLVSNMLLEGNSLPTNITIFFAFSTAAIAGCIGHLLLTGTAAQLTPETENRSTPLRLSMLMLTAVAFVIGGYGVQIQEEFVAQGVVAILIVMLGIMWIGLGSLIVAESPIMTPRIRRELPSSFLARCTLTWLTPGPATGLVFCVTVIVVLATMVTIGMNQIIIATRGAGAAIVQRWIYQMAMLYIGYAVALLVLIRVIVAGIRLRGNPRVEIGAAVLVIILIVFSLTPYVIELHMNDYRSVEYSRWQMTNVFWTFIQASDRRLAYGEEYIVVTAAAAMFAICLFAMPTTVMPRKIATPKRVEEEQAK